MAKRRRQEELVVDPRRVPDDELQMGWAAFGVGPGGPGADSSAADAPGTGGGDHAGGGGSDAGSRSEGATVGPGADVSVSGDPSQPGHPANPDTGAPDGGEGTQPATQPVQTLPDDFEHMHLGWIEEQDFDRIRDQIGDRKKAEQKANDPIGWIGLAGRFLEGVLDSSIEAAYDDLLSRYENDPLNVMGEVIDRGKDRSTEAEDRGGDQDTLPGGDPVAEAQKPGTEEPFDYLQYTEGLEPAPPPGQMQMASSARMATPDWLKRAQLPLQNAEMGELRLGSY